MPFSKANIVNKALVKLGSRPVVNLEDDGTDESVTALNLYDIALEALLSETLWTFATKRKLLQTTTDPIAFSVNYEDLAYSYQRPIDAIRIFQTNDQAAYWKEEGDQILSNTAGLGVIYTFRNEVTETYPVYFVDALADRLAADMAYPLLNSMSKTEDMNKAYERVSLPKAKSQNGQVGTAKELNDNYWINARLGGPNVAEFG